MLDQGNGAPAGLGGWSLPMQGREGVRDQNVIWEALGEKLGGKVSVPSCICILSALLSGSCGIDAFVAGKPSGVRALSPRQGARGGGTSLRSPVKSLLLWGVALHPPKPLQLGSESTSAPT